MATAKASEVKVTSSLVSDDFISLQLKEDGRFVPFMIDKSHATYSALRKALEQNNTKKIPQLVTMARVIANKTNGLVKLTRDGVTFKGNEVAPVFYAYAERIQREGKDIAPWLRFLNNLFRNPEVRAINEITEFIQKAQENKYPVPITDDGCFLGYKAVNGNYTDCHTGKYDNSVGAVQQMPRKAVDPDRRNECSCGFHFCSLGYLGSFGGQHIMAVKINPKDIVAIPRHYDYSKGRTWRYEVVYEVSDKNNESSTTHAPVMQQAVVPVAAERKALLEQLLSIPAVKRAIRRGKIKRTTIVKQTYGRLAKLYARYQSLVPTAQAPSVVTSNNTLKMAREKAKLTIGQIAKEMGISYKGIWALEKSINPKQASVDAYLEAIATLVGISMSSYKPRAASPVATPEREAPEADRDRDDNTSSVGHEESSSSFDYEDAEEDEEDED